MDIHIKELGLHHLLHHDDSGLSLAHTGANPHCDILVDHWLEPDVDVAQLVHAVLELLVGRVPQADGADEASPNTALGDILSCLNTTCRSAPSHN